MFEESFAQEVLTSLTAPVDHLLDDPERRSNSREAISPPRAVTSLHTAARGGES